MRILSVATIVLAGALLGGSAAQAQWTQNDQAQVCYAEAQRQALQGEALKEFMEDCTAGQLAQRPTIPAEVMRQCEERHRTLSGEDKRIAMQECTNGWW